MVKTALKTERLLLEPLTKEHAAKLFEPLRDESLYKFIPTFPPKSVEALETRFAKLEAGAPPESREAWLNWALRLAETGEYVGQLEATVTETVSLFAYTVFPAHQRKGYAKEACRELLRHLFDDLHCERVSILMDTRNTASIRLAESLGLRRTEIITNADIIHGERSDEYRYELDRENRS